MLEVGFCLLVVSLRDAGSQFRILRFDRAPDATADNRASRLPKFRVFVHIAGEVPVQVFAREPDVFLFVGLGWSLGFARYEVDGFPVVVVSPPVQTEKARMKTILVASYGWPTADMQPSRRQAARR